MIPNQYLTEAQLKAIADSLNLGVGTTTQSNNGISKSSIPTFGNYISSALLANILDTDLNTSVTSTISEAGLSATDLEYLNGMRDRITAGFADAYADIPLLSPVNAQNLKAGQSVQNARDLFLQAIFRFDPRYGARQRLSTDNTIDHLGSEHYELPNRANFMRNPYIRAFLGLHGAPDVTNIDDTGTSGLYQVTTNNAHGLYDSMGVYSDGASGTEATNARSITSVTRTGSFTTASNHYFLDAQRFHTEQPDAGHAYLDPQNRFLGYQRRPYVDSTSATTFELHRNESLTNKIDPSYYSGNITATSNSGVLNLECGEIQMFIDGVPYLLTYGVGNIQTLTVTDYNQSTGEFTQSALWLGPTSGQSVRFGQAFDGPGYMTHELFYVRTADYKFKLYWDAAGTNQFYLNRRNTTAGFQNNVVSTTDTGSRLQVNFSEAHNMVNGGVARLTDLDGVAYDGQTVTQAIVPDYVNALTFDAVLLAFNSAGTVGIAVPNTGLTYAYTTNGGASWTYSTLPTPLGPGSLTRYWSSLVYSSGDNQFVLVGDDGLLNEAYYTTDGVTWTVFDLNTSNSTDPAVQQPLYCGISDGNQMVFGGETDFIAPESATVWHSFFGTVQSGGYQTTLLHPRPQGVWNAGTLNGRFYSLNSSVTKNNSSYVYSTGSTWWTSELVSRAWDNGVTECLAMASIGTRTIALARDTSRVFYTDTPQTSGWSSVTPTGIDWDLSVTLSNSIDTLAQNGTIFMALCNGGDEVAISSNGTSWTRLPTPITAANISYQPSEGLFIIVGPSGAVAKTPDGYNWVDSAGDAPRWVVSDNTVYEDGQVLRLFNGTVGFGSYNANNGTSYTWTAPIPTAKSNYYLVKRVPGSTTEIQIYVDSALTQLYAPWNATTGTFNLTTLIVQPIFYTKEIDSDTVELYVDSGLTNAWYPSTRPVLTSQAGNFRTTDLEGLEPNITLAENLRPVVYFKTSTYSSVDVYWDKNLTSPVPGATGSATNIIASTTAMWEASLGTTTWTFDTAVTVKPVFFVKNVSGNPKKFELYVNSSLSIPYNTPAIGTAQTSGSFTVDVYGTNDAYVYKITNVECINPGTKTYWYKDYTGAVEDRVNAQNINYWATPYWASNSCSVFPASQIAYEFDPVNNAAVDHGAYYGHARLTKAGSDEANAGGRKGIDTTLYIGVGSPLILARQFPGRFINNTEMLLYMRAADDVGTPDVLNQNGGEWDDDNAVNQELRRWPTSIQPVSASWSIEQPNQTFDTMNYTRFVRAKEITQYRIKLTYPPMTREQAREFITVIHAARGSFKPFRYTLPTQTDGLPAAFAYDNLDPAYADLSVLLARTTTTSGSRVIEVDGLPCETTNVIGAGQAINLNTSNSTGTLTMPIHGLNVNVFGEANMRVNNAVPTELEFGHQMPVGVTEVDVFLDGNSVDLEVDTRGYHRLQVELVTKRIF